MDASGWSRSVAGSTERGSARLRIGADGRPALHRPASALWRADPAPAPVPRRPRVTAVTIPDSGTSRILALSIPTVAGRYFFDPPVDPNRLPAAPETVFVVHVPVDRTGFRVAGRPVPPRMLAKAIRSCPEWRGRPVVVVGRGTSAARVAGGALMSALAAALGAAVVSSDAAVHLGPRSLSTAGDFLRWSPPERRLAGRPAMVRLGPVLPRVVAPAHPVRAARPAHPEPVAPVPTAPVPTALVNAPAVEPLPEVPVEALPPEPMPEVRVDPPPVRIALDAGRFDPTALPVAPGRSPVASLPAPPVAAPTVLTADPVAAPVPSDPAPSAPGAVGRSRGGWLRAFGRGRTGAKETPAPTSPAPTVPVAEVASTSPVDGPARPAVPARSGDSAESMDSAGSVEPSGSVEPAGSVEPVGSGDSAGTGEPARSEVSTESGPSAGSRVAPGEEAPLSRRRGRRRAETHRRADRPVDRPADADAGHQPNVTGAAPVDVPEGAVPPPLSLGLRLEPPAPPSMSGAFAGLGTSPRRAARARSTAAAVELRTAGAPGRTGSGSTPRTSSGPTDQPSPAAGVRTASGAGAGREPAGTDAPASTTPAGATPASTTPAGTAASSTTSADGAGAGEAVAPSVRRPPADGRGAAWTPVSSSLDRQDREYLRSLLGWRYEAHARAVSGVLALQPGMRSTAGSDDLVSGLIAVRAQLSGLGAQVDRWLRGEAGPGGDPADLDLRGAELLGRFSNVGLRRLPAVVGPVFRPGTPDPRALERYRAGMQLVEPAFAEARLRPHRTADSTAEYAIWSSTARRTERLLGVAAASAPSRVLFAAGSRFLVLGVDEIAGGLPRILLREVSGADAADPAIDERTRERLLEALGRGDAASSSPAGPVPAQWQLPIGIRDDAVAFEPLDNRKDVSA
jgi:hypothetical protein